MAMESRPLTGRPPKDYGVGNALRELRLARGLSMQQVADESGVSMNYIWMLESGRRDLKRKYIKLALAEVFSRHAVLATGEVQSVRPEDLASEIVRSQDNVDYTEKAGFRESVMKPGHFRFSRGSASR